MGLAPFLHNLSVLQRQVEGTKKSYLVINIEVLQASQAIDTKPHVGVVCDWAAHEQEES